MERKKERKKVRKRKRKVKGKEEMVNAKTRSKSPLEAGATAKGEREKDGRNNDFPVDDREHNQDNVDGEDIDDNADDDNDDKPLGLG